MADALTASQESSKLKLMYKGISDAVSADDVNPFERLKMAIVGRPKKGKSWLAATAPGEIYFFDFDGRKASLAGKPNVTVKTYRDINPKYPSAVQKMEQDLALFEYNKTKGQPIPDTFVFDSATHWVKAAELELISKSGRLKREIRFGATNSLEIPAGWDVSTAIKAHMENTISRAYELGNVIVIFHEEPEKDKIKSKDGEPVYTGKYVVHPYYTRMLLSTFNEVWRIEISEGGEYFVTTKSTNNFEASTTLRIDKVEKPSINDIIAKHLKAVSSAPKI